MKSPISGTVFEFAGFASYSATLLEYAKSLNKLDVKETRYISDLREFLPSYKNYFLSKHRANIKTQDIEEDLIKKTGIKDTIFCHKKRFMAVFKNKKAALLAASYVMKKNETG